MSNERTMIRRVRCWFLGCVCAQDYPACHHCGADLYGGPFLEEGRLEPLFRFGRCIRQAIRKLGPKKCCQCGKKYRSGYDDQLCSEECFDEWLPF